MPTSSIKTGIGDVQELRHKRRVFTDNLTNLVRIRLVLPAHLQNLQRQSRDRWKCFTIFNALKYLRIHASSILSHG
jgi:hypothetical protein